MPVFASHRYIHLLYTFKNFLFFLFFNLECISFCNPDINFNVTCQKGGKVRTKQEALLPQSPELNQALAQSQSDP